MDTHIILTLDLGRFHSVLCWYDPVTRAAELGGFTSGTRQWKSIIFLRKRLVSERVRTQNHIRATLVSQGLAAPRGVKAWSEAGLSGLATLARPLHECAIEDLWRGDLSIMLERLHSLEKQIHITEPASTPSPRRMLTWPFCCRSRASDHVLPMVIVSHLQDAKRFRSGDQVSAYAGLVPKQFQGGETDRRGRMTRRGPRLLRSAMVECAWCSLRYNAWSQETWKRLQANGLSKKKAVVALARKLLVRAWAILRTGKLWHAPTLNAA